MKYFISIFFVLLVHISWTQDANTLYNDGLKLKSEKKYTEALEKFFKARIKDDSPELRYESGLCYIALNDYLSAIVVFKELRQIWTNDYEVNYLLGISFGSSGSYDSSINCFKKSLSIKPDAYENYREMGINYFSKSEHNLALENLNFYQSKVTGPYPYYIHYYKGYCYNALKNYNTAIFELEKALTIKDDYNTLLELGFANYKLKNNDVALVNYLNALEIKNTDILPYKEIANIFKTKKNYDSSLVWYLKAYDFNPKDANVNYGLGYSHSQKKDYNSATTYFKKVLELDKNFTNAYIELGAVQVIESKYQEALLNLNKAIELNPEFSNPYFYKGIIFVEQKNKIEALQMLSEVKKRNSPNAEFLEKRISVL